MLPDGGNSDRPLGPWVPGRVLVARPVKAAPGSKEDDPAFDPTPVELVLAALGSCQEITYRAFATAMGIALDGVSAQVEGDIDFRGFFAIDPTVRPGFGALRVNITLRSSAGEAEIAQLIAAVNSHCPVLDMLNTPVPTTLQTTVVTD